MEAPKNGFKSGLSTQIPTAIAMLLVFILGNVQWSGTISRIVSDQTTVLKQLAEKQSEQTKLMNDITITLEKITTNIEKITGAIDLLKKG
jgi:hypothetical protein